jgi:uncharacterized protein YbjT (DUF2867 family)
MANGILLFGGSRETGLEVAKILAARAEPVTAFVRPTSELAALKALGVTLFHGDVMDPASVAAAFRSGKFHAVISSLGAQRGQVPRPDYEGTRIIIDAAKAAGVLRMLMVTVIGAGDSKADLAPKVWEVLGEVILLKTLAENYLIDSGLEYTILRPGGMSSDLGTGTAIRTEDRTAMGVITRADLARLVVDCLDDPGSSRRIYHTVDPQIRWQPPLQRGEDIPKRPG